MLEDADNFADFFRCGLPYYLLFTLPILIMVSSTPALASSEFSTMQRMSQFDVNGVSYGCRASALNLEAKSLHTWTTTRHCVMSRFQDMSIDQFREIRAKAGGLILLLPENFSELSTEEKQHIYLLEQAMMAQEISIPVYFSKYNADLNAIIDEISINAQNKQHAASATNKKESALTEIINSVSANGYQVFVSGATHTANKQSKIPIIQGELAPIKNYKNAADNSGNLDAINKLPLIIISAHINTFGLIDDHLTNPDVAVFMHLVDIYSKLYNTAGTSPKYRVMFLLSESGMLLNYQGMKKWIDSNLEENVQIQNAEFVMCLDSIGQKSDKMYMHVSKPPKDGSQMNVFYKQLRTSGQKFGNVTVEGVHKKINLADVQLAWEHERFSMKRMPAFTLSSVKSHKDPYRSTIFDENKEKTMEYTQNNAKIIAETLTSYVYGVQQQNGEIFTGANTISIESIKPWLYIRSTLINNDLKNAFEKYLKNVKIIYDKPDAREPDFMLYDGQEGTLNVYSVKPAVFDLFLTFAIIGYLVSVYFAIILFPDLYSAICKLSNNNNKTKICKSM